MIHPATLAATECKPGALKERAISVCAVVPCFNRPGDLALLLGDLRELALGLDGGTVALHVVVIDNASQPPIALPTVPGFGLDLVRLPVNTGGSGGFSEGLRRAVERSPDFVWLVDSDARVSREALVELLRVMDDEPAVVAAGSALIDKHSGRVYEVGGVVDRRNGSLYPAREGEGTGESPVECDYLAACSAIVRTGAILATGVFPDTFLNGDDAAWFLAMKRVTGGRVVGVPRSRVTHPDTRVFRTWGRYFQSRNGMVPAIAAGLGRRAILRRQLHEGAAAVGQACVGRRDLAELHVLGLRDAARGKFAGPAPMDTAPGIVKQRLLTELKSELEQLPDGATVVVHEEVLRNEPVVADALSRMNTSGRIVVKSLAASSSRMGAAIDALARIGGREADLAIVPARAHPECWFRAERTATVANGTFVVGETPSAAAFGAAWVGLRASVYAGRAAARRPKLPECGPIDSPERAPSVFARTCDISAIVLCYNRRAAVEKTLQELRAVLPITSEVIVVDNGSRDGTAAMVREKFPECEVVELGVNSGVAGFNRGVERARGEFVLILDDDSWPDAASLADAVRTLREDGALGAATMLPRHPTTNVAEWPEAERLSPGVVRDWPIMGCGNLVRTELWRRAGGYDEAFFLYRNDWDLALKLRSLGYGTAFDPRWTVWHDSPAAKTKSPRWFHLAVRNWVWLARRHGRGLHRYLGPMLAFSRAMQIARGEPARSWNAMRGVVEGWISRAPALPLGMKGSTRGFERLLEVKMKDHFPGR